MTAFDTNFVPDRLPCTAALDGEGGSWTRGCADVVRLIGLPMAFIFAWEFR